MKQSNRPMDLIPVPAALLARRLRSRPITLESTKKHGKPWLHLSERCSYESPGERPAAFVRENNIKTLNVAGTRGSKEPAVAKFVKHVLEEAFFPRPQGWIGGPGEG
jgi:Circularly permutated YpsA SLOG family